MIPAAAIAEGIDALPTLPEAVARLTALLQDEHATIDDFEQAVHSDPAVTANLLGAANSAFHRGIDQVSTVGEAVARIGLKRVCDIAVAATFRRALPLRISGYGIDAPTFWMHCTATAVYAEALARERHLPCLDLAFTAGLLHDVGKLVVGGFLALLVPESNWWTFGTAAEERNLLGSNHCDVGQEIAARWHLPSAYAQTCRWHHEPSAAADGADVDLAAVVHAADYMAYRAGFPGGSGKDEALDRFVELRLDLDREQLEQMALDRAGEVRRMSQFTSSCAA